MSTFAPSRFEARPGCLLVGLRRTHRFSNIGETVTAQWDAFLKLPIVQAALPTVLYGATCATNQDKGTMEYLTGIEVEGFDDVDPALGRMRIPDQYYAVFEHPVHPTPISQTFTRIWSEWYPQSGMTFAPTPDFELYPPDYNSPENGGRIEIYFPVVKPA